MSTLCREVTEYNLHLKKEHSSQFMGNGKCRMRWRKWKQGYELAGYCGIPGRRYIGFGMSREK